MGVSEGELKVIQAMQEAQNSANTQSANNVVTFKKFFGPKMDALTESIISASNSSSFLSKVLIGVTVVGIIIAGLSWYQSYSDERAIQSLSTEQLRCVFRKALGNSDIAMLAAIESCKREATSEQATPSK